MEKMNERAQELGMTDTHFVNCTGLDDDPNAKEHLTSAYDIAVMSRELLKHDEIKEFTTIWMDSVRDGQFGLSNTNKLVRFYQGTTGLKTGYTSAAGFCISASAERDGMELIAVVLHCASSTDRFESAKALLDYGFANYGLVSAAPGDAASRRQSGAGRGAGGTDGPARGAAHLGGEERFAVGGAGGDSAGNGPGPGGAGPAAGNYPALQR